jgi:methylmalonyl-CoA mutase N-terminal domain/subunit
MDEALRERQIEKLRQVRASRSQSAVDRALEGVKRAAGSRENIMPHILGAVEAYTTIGEISDALRSVWGEHEG